MGVEEKTLGKRLQLARRRAGLTQQELCQKAGLSYSTLAKIERGAIKSPSVFTVATIASATGSSLEILLDIKPSESAPPAAETKKRSKNGVRFVYLDLNGVLVRFFHQAFTKIAAEARVSAEIVETLFWRHNDSVCKGEMSLAKLNEAFAAELGLKEFDWQKSYMASIEPMPGIAEFVQWAGEHYEVGILSNSMPGFIDNLIEAGLIPKIEYASIVDSSKTGAIKPEAKAYKIAQELAAVDPDEILLIDNERPNLTAADHIGWQVLGFDDFEPEQSIQRAKASLEF